MSYDVRDVLTSVRDNAPPARTSVEDIIGAGRRIRARRRLTVLTAGAAALVAVAVGVVAVQGGPPEEEVLPAVAAPARASFTLPSGFSTAFGEHRVGPYRLGPGGQVAPGYQELPVYRDGQHWDDDDGTAYPLVDGTITVYRPGVYDPSAFGRGNATLRFGRAFPVTVGGLAGMGREMRYDWPVGPRGEYVRNALAWQYAPDAWATYTPGTMRSDQSLADAVRIAEAVPRTLAAARTIRAPYPVDRLPTGWRPVAATETGDRVSSVVSEVYVSRRPVTQDRLAAKVDEVFPAVKISVTKGDPKNESIRGKDGLYCYPASTSCTIVRGGYTIEVLDFNGATPPAEVERLAGALRPVDFTDRGTWLPVTG